MFLSVKQLVLSVFRIHLMAGRVPADAQRAEASSEMEKVFVKNLSYAADVLSKVGDDRPPTSAASRLCSLLSSLLYPSFILDCSFIQF